jgi:DNA modification methylase
VILIGDVRERLKELPDQSVNCCVTSPPYWGLRDYGNDGQIGLEQTPDAFIAELVSVFSEVKRVLRDDGTLWLNIGDSYASFRDGKATPDTTRGTSLGILVDKGKASNRKASTFANTSIKHKDLVGIPWMLAFALRADGWYLRQDIIWHKPNPMPESVRDRCTKAHEYIFLLSKSPKYYFDNQAMQEPAKSPFDDRASRADSRAGTSMNSVGGKTGIRFGGNKYGDSDDPKHATKSGNEYIATGTRNKRSVWSVTTKPFKGAHFATFPPALIEPCILAGSPRGGVVLDPFFGAGTTGLVAQRHNRKWIGCELNPEYAAIAQARIESESTLFTLGDNNDDA